MTIVELLVDELDEEETETHWHVCRGCDGLVEVEDDCDCECGFDGYCEDCAEAGITDEITDEDADADEEED